MEDKTKELCESFIENRDIVKKVFSMESTLIYPIAANALTANGIKGDVDKLKACKKIINKNAGVLSYLKGDIAIPFAANLSTKEDPKAAFDKVVRYYNIIKRQFNRSQFSALLAILLSDIVQEDNIESVIERGKAIYTMIKDNHPFLTNDQTSVLAGMLAMSEKSNVELIDDMEKCYDLLKIKFSNKSSIHTVSHILSLTRGSAREKVEHMIDLYDMLKESGKKYGVYTELATLASVSILDDDLEKLRDTIIEIDDFLSKQKGYGLLGIDKKTRLMHATMLTADLYDTAQAAHIVASASALAMAAAQQATICIIIASSSEIAIID